MTNAMVLEHVRVADLPQAWRDRLGHQLLEEADVRVTIRIEREAEQKGSGEEFVTDDPAFGIWRDRDDVVDVEDYVRRIRAPRFNRDGSRNDLP